MHTYSIKILVHNSLEWNESVRIFQTKVLDSLNIDISRIFSATKEDLIRIEEIASECKIKIQFTKL
jgi:hypothetical protein